MKKLFLALTTVTQTENASKGNASASKTGVERPVKNQRVYRESANLESSYKESVGAAGDSQEETVQFQFARVLARLVLEEECFLKTSATVNPTTLELTAKFLLSAKIAVQGTEFVTWASATAT